MAKIKKVRTYVIESIKYDTIYRILHRFYFDTRGDDPKELVLHPYSLNELVEVLKDYKLGKAIYSFNAVTGRHQFHGIPVTIDSTIKRYDVLIKP